MEIAAAGRPAVLVPYPHATGDHQDANARWMARWRRRGGDPRRRARRRRASRRWSPTCSPTRRGSARCPRPRLASPSPTPPSGSPREVLEAVAARAVASELERPQAPLHRDRRRRDERPGARLPPARRRGDRLRPRRVLLHGAAAARRGSSRGSATTPPRCPTTRRWSSRPRSPMTTLSWRSPASAASGSSTAASCSPSSAPSAACWRSPAPTARRPRRRCCVHALRASGADPAFFLGGELPGAGPGRRAGERRLGRGGVGGRRGRRERRELPRAAAGGGGGHQPRARPPLALGLAGRSSLEAFARFSAPAVSAWSREPDVALPGAASRRVEIRFALEPEPGASVPPRRPTCWRPRSSRSRGAAAASGRAAPESTPRSRLAVPGRHNVANALAALGAARRYRGRRRPRRGRRGARRLPRGRPPARAQGRAATARVIYDDYAHHPTEVAATLEAARELEPRRLIAAFQPHLYSRTKALARRARRGPRGRRRGRRPRRLPGPRGAGRARSRG